MPNQATKRLKRKQTRKLCDAYLIDSGSIRSISYIHAYTNLYHIAQFLGKIQIMGEHQYHFRVFCFFSLGMWIFFTPALVCWIALEDILAGTLWSSTVVLIVFSIPDIIAKVLSPYVVTRISFHCAFFLLTLLLVGSYVLLVVIDDVRIRMVAVGVLAFGLGFGMIVGARMLAYYEHADVHANAFCNGVNFSAFGASLVYTG